MHVNNVSNNKKRINNIFILLTIKKASTEKEVPGLFEGKKSYLDFNL